MNADTLIETPTPAKSRKVGKQASTTTTLLVVFNLRIKGSRLKFFREAMIRATGNPEELFSNEVYNNDNTITYIKRYPLIQYRIVNGHAAILALNQGVEALKSFLNTDTHTVEIAGSDFDLQVIEKTEEKNINITLLAAEEMKMYTLKTWLPLANPQDYLNFTTNKLMSDIEKTLRLQEKLTNHLVEFFKAVQWRGAVHKIKVKILDKSTPYIVQAADNKMMAYNITFACNINLPANIGLGKLKSKGFGLCNNGGENVAG